MAIARRAGGIVAVKAYPGPRVSDRGSMLKSMNCRRLAQVLTLALLAGLGGGFAPSSVLADDDEVAPDLIALQAKAESGNVKAQTQLADTFIGSDDFTNAVVWYRKAAEQGDVTAQLSLASLLMAGRGAAKNPQEAAKWLRAAADRIETNKPAFGPGAVAARTTNAPPAIHPPEKYPPNAIIITKSNLPPATNLVASVSPASPPVTNQLTITRVPRAGVVDQGVPALHEVQPALRSPTEPR